MNRNKSILKRNKREASSLSDVVQVDGVLVITLNSSVVISGTHKLKNEGKSNAILRRSLLIIIINHHLLKSRGGGEANGGEIITFIIAKIPIRLRSFQLTLP